MPQQAVGDTKEQLQLKAKEVKDKLPQVEALQAQPVQRPQQEVLQAVREVAGE